ncbi:mucin-7-like [Glycine max]|uniref:mucin-7-like n=1 Tax=Glycine max TaxID=3847 RepID=UPI0007193865|nr:mucin-7-like [Glycine max]|eukprot:XP_014627098.1 mucin-7-like [Glycine max]
MESRKRARTDDIPSSSTPAPPSVELEPTDPQSPVVNPPSSPELEVVLPSPPLIIISDSPSRETVAPPDSPAREVADPPDSPVGGVADLSDSSSREVVALSDSPVFPSCQDPSPYPWPTPEQFMATVAWPGDRPNFQAGVGPTEAPRDEDGAQEDDDMADVMDFFL